MLPKAALTDDADSREVLMKDIDRSYYCEGYSAQGGRAVNPVDFWGNILYDEINIRIL